MMSETGKFVTLGEMMLRLKSPGHERFFQSPLLEATFGGGEANVAISLVNFGLDAEFVSAVPANPVGDALLRQLRARGVATSNIPRQGDRLGLYFLEAGSGPRPSVVVYDRAHSAIATAHVTDFDWDAIFTGAAWFHVTGITPALSETAAGLASRAVQEAKSHGARVSCDLNYRKKLWKYGKTAPEVMVPLMAHVDVVVANEEDIQLSLGLEMDQQIGDAKLSRDKYAQLARRVLDQHEHVQAVAITLRESHSANHNDWSAMCLHRGSSALFSKRYALTDIVDRVGGGDSFAAGFIYALQAEMAPQAGLEFAVAASALKHTIPGDFNRVSVEEVQRLAGGDASGRVQR